MNAAALILAACTWANPGAHPYTGTAAAAIEAKTQIPAATRAKLIRRAESHDYDDVIVIDRDAIRSTRYAYEPAISDMAFADGRRCGTVDRSGWTPEHAETAMVFCEDGWCVARPAVCNNWSIVTRREREQPAAVARDLDQPAAGAEPTAGAAVEPAAPVVGEQSDALPVRELPVDGGVPFGSFGGVTVVGGSGGCFCCDGPVPVGPVSPIPEPGTWVLIGLGVAVILARRRLR